MPIGGLLMGVLASSIGILEAIAIGGALSLLTGVVALVWWRRLRRSSTTAGEEARAEVPATAEALASAPALAQSTEPRTSAAFNPPNPNEVLSTRR
jgi:predicted lipid-binding transport protein (Tim44 family)